jgi:Zn-dependent protease/CBS domain-containing protein
LGFKRTFTVRRTIEHRFWWNIAPWFFNCLIFISWGQDMFGRRVTLFKLFGFAVRLDASWIIIALLVTWSLAGSIFPHAYPYLSRGSYWWMGIAGALGLFAGIVLHELCHSLVANHYQLPMRGITLFVFGGVAEMGGEPPSSKVEFLMAIAGPIASIILGAIFRGIQVAVSGKWPVPVVGVIAYLAWINWILALFNLIPAFPLDGGRVLRAALWHYKRDLRAATEIASRIGSGFGILLMIFGFVQLFYGSFVSAVWYFLIGTFLRGASQASYQQVLLKSVLEGEPVRRFMRPHPVAVRPDMSIRELVEDYMYRYDFKVYPVVTEPDNLVGCVATQDVRKVPKEEWDRYSVSEVSKPCSERNTISPDADALNALTKIQEAGGTGLLVTERNHLLAVISPRDVMNFIAAKLRLEGKPIALPNGSRL